MKTEREESACGCIRLEAPTGWAVLPCPAHKASSDARDRVSAAIYDRVHDALKSTVGEIFTPDAKSQVVERISECLNMMLAQPHGVTAGELREVGFEIDASIPDEARTRGVPHVVDARLDDEHVVHFRLEARFEAP